MTPPTPPREPRRPARRPSLPADCSTHGLTRRRLLVGAAIGGLLAACGGDDDGSGTSGGSAANGGSGGLAGTYTIVQRFPQQVAVPGVVRLPISLSTGAAELIQDGPDELGAQVVDIDGSVVGGRITAARRALDPAPYYAFTPTIEEPGVYALVVDGGPTDGASFQVFDPADVPVPTPGETLSPFDTPTADDPAGVDPICTRVPDPCPFHEITLREALAAATPVAYYVGTPAYCSTGTCAPALEALIEAAGAFEDRLAVVHAEVYTDDTATVVAPAVEALGMFYEPALFVTDAAGVIVDRLDSVFDTDELLELFGRVTAG